MSGPTESQSAVAASPLARAGWLVLGSLSVVIGSVGIIVPGLPTTVFFIVAAWAFSKSSPRLEAWVLGLPRVGPMVRDHRNGLGMPRRAKRLAIAMIVFFVTLSAWLVQGWAVRGVTLAVGAIGVGYVGWRVPTKEAVLGARSAR